MSKPVNDHYQCHGCGCECPPYPGGCGCDCPCCARYFFESLPVMEDD